MKFLQKFVRFYNFITIKAQVLPRIIQIQFVYSGDALSKEMVQRWLCHVRSEKIHVKGTSRSDQSITEKVYEIIAKAEQDQHLNSPSISKELSIHHLTVLNRLKKTGCKRSSIFGRHKSAMKSNR